jgi:putative MFS transporter
MQDVHTVASISARIDRLPSSRWLWGWVARISFGAFFEIYETALTAVLSPLLVSAGIFHKDRGGLFGLPDLATFGFSTFFGLFLGSLLFSAIADRFGRRAIFTYSLVWYALATLIMGAQSSALAICFWRFVAAIGVGAEIVVVDAYLSELMPKSMRGRGFAISKAIQYLAVPLAAILATLVAKKTILGFGGWQVMLVIPMIGAVLIWWVRRGLPESPRWLAGHGRVDEARAILDGIESKLAPLSGEASLQVEQDVLTQVPLPSSSFMELFRGELRLRTWTLLTVSCATTIAFFGFGNWLPSLLQARGVEVTKSLAYSAVIAFTYPLAPFLFSFFADRIERKWQIIVGSSLIVVAGLLFAAQTAIAGWIICGFLVTLGSVLTSYGTHTYRSELFPTSVRARGIGFVYSIDRLTAAFNSYLIGFILVTGGVSVVLGFIAGASLFAIIVVALFGPRTRGLALEAIRNPVRHR